MTTIYKITFDNYLGENFIELYHKKENAHARYQELIKEGKKYSEFYEDNFSFSYFNADCNEYSTFIDLKECDLESLFYD